MAAPAYMKADAEKNPDGRPLKFKTVLKLQRAIDAYFKKQDDYKQTIVTRTGQVVEVPAPMPYTMSGLALYLGIDRKTLVNYNHKQEFFPTVKRAREMVQQDVERRMLVGSTPATAAIFSLKNNFEWVDKVESDVHHTGDVEFVNAVPRPKRATD